MVQPTKREQITGLLDLAENMAADLKMSWGSGNVGLIKKAVSQLRYLCDAVEKQIKEDLWDGIKVD